MFHEGQQLGEYTLVEKLGRGGFGEVWLAETSDGQFAVKLPHKDQINWKQITQEINIWMFCGKNLNVLPFIDAKILDGQIVIISEFAPDGSLEDLLREKGSFSVEKAVEIILGISNGLEHLHKNGIIHRDLKPANILFNGKTPRLADFGISRIMTASSSSQTIAGTFAYMAPECFDGKRNIKTDMWSVGVILYQMLTGKLPFPQKEQTMLIGAIIMREPEALPNFIPDKICTTVMELLQKNPAERIKTIRYLRPHLLPFIALKFSPIVKWVIEQFKKEEGIDLASDKMAVLRIIEEAEKAKSDLLRRNQTEINLPFISSTPLGPKHFVKQLTLEKFNELIRDSSTLPIE
ncbi:hypothetical protein BH10ACI1_BH10ACI1_25050 [soil metagenome]